MGLRRVTHTMHPSLGKLLRAMLVCFGAYGFSLLLAKAAEHRLKEFSITVADEYSEIVRHEKASDEVQAVYYSFVVPASTDGTQSHLQVTVVQSKRISRLASKNYSGSPDAVQRLSDNVLLEMVGGIEKRRKGFKRTNPEDFSAGKHLFRKVAWTGTVEGKGMSGRAYGILVSDRFYCFAIQDFDAFVESSFKRLEPSLEHFHPLGAKP